MSHAMLLLVALLLLTATSCAPTINVTSAVDSEAARMWQRNIEVIERILQTDRFDQDELDKATRFLERTTGICAMNEHHYVGTLPSSLLDEAFAEWKSWWEVHKQQVVYRPDVDALVQRGNELLWHGWCRPPANSRLNPAAGGTALTESPRLALARRGSRGR